MDIQKALEETGKVYHTKYGKATTASLDTQGILTWNVNDVPVRLRSLMGQYWQPYHPEPKKCRACELCEGVYGNELESIVMRFLLKKYCTCKGD